MKHFTMKELSRSDTANALNIPNEPGLLERQNLESLVEKILDPLREAYGKPIHVTSGYRSPKVNELVGGAKASQHKYGQAADIHGTPNTLIENNLLFELIQSLKLPFDQLIHEKGVRGVGPKWIHVSHKNNGENRHDIRYL